MEDFRNSTTVHLVAEILKNEKVLCEKTFQLSNSLGCSPTEYHLLKLRLNLTVNSYSQFLSEILVQWVSKAPNRATVGNLCGKLIEIGCVYASDTLKINFPLEDCRILIRQPDVEGTTELSPIEWKRIKSCGFNRDQDFSTTCRDAEITELREFVEHKKKFSLNLFGEDGIGKSYFVQLVLDSVNNSRDFCCLKFDFGNNTDLRKALISYGSITQPTENLAGKDSQDIFEGFVKHLNERRGSTRLIFFLDNVKSQNMSLSVNFTKFVYTFSSGSVILTSSIELDSNNPLIPISNQKVVPLNITQVRPLILSYLPFSGEDMVQVLDEIFTVLQNYIPCFKVACKLIQNRIERTGCKPADSIREYFSKLCVKKCDIVSAAALKQQKLATNQINMMAVLTSFINQPTNSPITKSHAQVQLLLRYLPYLDIVCGESVDGLTTILYHVHTDIWTDGLEEGLEILGLYGIVEYKDSTVWMSFRVQEALRAIHSLNGETRSILHTLGSRAFGVFTDDEAYQPRNAAHLLCLWEFMTPFPDYCYRFLWIVTYTAEELIRLGDYEKLVQITSQVSEILRIDEMDLLEKDPTYLVMRQKLGFALQHTGKYSKAYETLKAVVSGMNSVFGLGDIRMINSLSYLGSTCYYLGKHEEYIAIFSQLLVLFEEGNNIGAANFNHTRIQFQQKIAIGLLRLGRTSEAIESMKGCVQDCISDFGKTDSRTLNMQHDLASFYAEGKLYQQAKDLYNEVLRRSFENYKNEGTEKEYHTEIISCKEMLVVVEWRMGNFLEAVESAREMFTELKGMLGRRHKSTIHAEKLLQEFENAHLNCGEVLPRSN